MEHKSFPRQEKVLKKFIVALILVAILIMIGEIAQYLFGVGIGTTAALGILAGILIEREIK